ncbi:MAG TPA: hypothetical protein ENI23_16000 [bacterium]|nr:hypothetical protein [bacterium]
MKFLLKWITIPSILIFAPSIAYGGLFSWLTGGVVEKIAEVSLGFKVINFFKAYMPLFSILIVAGMAVICFYGAVIVMRDFGKTVREAMKTDGISVSEWIWLVITFVPTIIIITALVWFGGLFAYAASDGMIDLINYKPK